MTDAPGCETPDFGIGTPQFGDEVLKSFGEAEVLLRSTEDWPRQPVCVMRSVISDKILVGEDLKRAYLAIAMPCGLVTFERRADDQGYNNVVTFPHALRFEGEFAKKRTVRFNTSRGEDPSEARRRAWNWHKEASRRCAGWIWAVGIERGRCKVLSRISEAPAEVQGGH